MNPKHSISRKNFLRIVAAAAGGLGLNSLAHVLAQKDDRKVYLPVSMNQAYLGFSHPGSIPASRVVHVHDSRASHWTGSSADYWNFANQEAVDNMVDQGMLLLTGTVSIADAWSVVLPSYQSGQTVAIKVSFGNTPTCTTDSGAIDGVIEPVNAVIRGLKAIGVAEEDIWIYETNRALPHRFVNGCDYQGVTLFDNGSCGHNMATFTSNDPSAFVYFNPPIGSPALSPRRITDVVVNADYLINLPVMKVHASAGVSLAFKNHFGTLENPSGLHTYIGLDSEYYSPQYCPFIDIHSHPQIAGKTVLTLCDGLFSAFHQAHAPVPWVTFGGQVPQSLFFSLDPVAVDCVMLDLLAQEFTQNPLVGEIDPRSGDYLALAGSAGLGTYERGNPWASPSDNGYAQIDYQKIELSIPAPPTLTSTPTSTPSVTSSATRTVAASGTVSASATATSTSTVTRTATPTPTGTSSGTPTGTATRTPTGTSTRTGTPDTPTVTRTPSEPLVYTDGPGGDVNTACDVNLHAEAHAYNGGQHGAIQFGTYNYGLIRFDLSALPASAVISQAHLYLGLYDGGTGSANIYALLAANHGWIEGTGDLDPALAGEPCWDAKESDGGGGVQVAWAGGSHGCGVVGTDISSQPIGAFSSSGAPTVVEVELDIATVQGWVGPSNTNYGIIIIPTATNSNHIALAEYGTSSYRPKLVVHYYL